jgi:hypothetical protein
MLNNNARGKINNFSKEYNITNIFLSADYPVITAIESMVGHHKHISNCWVPFTMFLNKGYVTG